MEIKLEHMIAKYDACVSALDCNKSCETCAFKERVVDDYPCNACYDMVLGMPIDPTKWADGSLVDNNNNGE